MELSELVNKYLGGEGSEEHPPKGTSSRQIYGGIQSKEYFPSLIATIFWQAFVYSDRFLSCVKQVGLRPDDYASRLFDGEVSRQCLPLAGPNSLFVVSHRGENSAHPRFDLLVFDKQLQGRKPLGLRQVDTTPDELMLGWARFVRNFAGKDRRIIGFPSPELPGVDNVDVIFNHGAGAALEVFETQRFGILFVGMPQLIPTGGSPSPAIKVHLSQSSPTISTGGVIARTRMGHIGVTSALHSFPPNRDLDVMAALQPTSRRNGRDWLMVKTGKSSQLMKRQIAASLRCQQLYQQNLEV